MADKRDVSSAVLGRREVIVKSDAEYRRYLRWNWGSAYTIICPRQPADMWRAIAKFGNEDELAAWTADELLDLIAHHYGPETEGYTKMLMDRLGKKYS
jgi:hypothetical protein